MLKGQREVRERIQRYEDNYPEFRNCHMASDVELIYGGGPPLVAWDNYTLLKEFLEYA